MQGEKVDKPDTKVLRTTDSTTIEAFLACCVQETRISRRSEEILLNGMVSKDCGITEIPNRLCFSKCVLDKVKSAIIIRYSDADKRYPDLVVVGAF